MRVPTLIRKENKATAAANRVERRNQLTAVSVSKAGIGRVNHRMYHTKASNQVNKVCV